MTEPLYVSNSGGTVSNALRAMATCDTQAWLTAHTYASEGERLAADAGTAAHAAIAHFLRTKNVDEALEAFAGAYGETASAIDPEGPNGRLRLENTTAILRAWMEQSNLPEVVRFVPDLIEVPFQYPLDAEGEVVFCGTIDAVGIQKSDGGLYIVDHKTTGMLTDWWLKKFRLDAQLSGYIWAAQKHTDKAILGGIINAIEFSRLPADPSRKCRKHGVVYAECSTMHAKFQAVTIQRTPFQIDAWKHTALRRAYALKRLLKAHPTPEYIDFLEQQGFFNGGCTLCDFHDFCYAGRPTDKINAMLMQKENGDA